jgi:hypothetical protein
LLLHGAVFSNLLLRGDLNVADVRLQKAERDLAEAGLL